jgi:hypothetical protein
VETYRTLDGEILDLRRLTDAEREFLQQCRAAYEAGMVWREFANRFVVGLENPLVKPTHGWITRQIWDHPLFQAVHDLGDRLGIRQGMLAPEGNAEADPFADGWIPSAEAAERKKVTLPGLHRAIDRGDVIARPAEHDGRRLVVSVNSLDRWSPNRTRQAARRRTALKSKVDSKLRPSLDSARRDWKEQGGQEAAEYFRELRKAGPDSR